MPQYDAHRRLYRFLIARDEYQNPARLRFLTALLAGEVRYNDRIKVTDVDGVVPPVVWTGYLEAGYLVLPPSGWHDRQVHLSDRCTLIATRAPDGRVLTARLVPNE